MQIVVVTSKIIESLRGDLAALHDAGAINKVTMRQFDTICAPPMCEFSADDIKLLREAGAALYFTASIKLISRLSISLTSWATSRPFDRARS